MSRLASWFSDLEKGNATTGAKKKNTPVERLIVRERTRAHTIHEDMITSNLHGPETRSRPLYVAHASDLQPISIAVYLHGT